MADLKVGKSILGSASWPIKGLDREARSLVMACAACTVRAFRTVCWRRGVGAAVRSIVAKVMWIIEVVGFSVGYSELERQTRAHNLLEFGWAQSGKRRNCVDSIPKNVC